MNKLVLAVLAGLLSMGALDARHNRNGNCCPTKCERSCERPCAKPACSPCARPCKTACATPPRCCKTIEVPETIMVKKTIEVPAEEVRTPNPDRIIRHPQPCEEVKIPLPQEYRIELRPVPDEVEVIKVPDTISYRCPADCNDAPARCATRCATKSRCCK